ncbi:MAG: IS1182 family transposase, partial [Chloroflexota bacterium]
MKGYRPWTPDQPYLLPPNPRDWLPEGHLAPFLLEVVESLDLSAIENAIQEKDPRGERPYHPRMMLELLLYGYCTGTFSSRKIERKTYEDVAFRYLAGGEHPYFSTICTFRRTHLSAIDGLFVQVVQVSRRVGLAKLGHVSLDGTKVAANASKHKAMSYERMVADEGRLRGEIAQLLARAEQQDAEDDERLGAGEPELDVPDELRRRTVRLERIQAAKAALEQEAREARAAQLREQAARARQAAAQATEESVRERALTRAAARESAAENLEPGAPAATARADALPTHTPKVTRAGLPAAKAQRNFTDSDSKIMERGGEFVQGYNCHAAVDGDSQVIVAQGASNQPPDAHYLVPMLERVRATTGALPEVATADAGFWAPGNASWCDEQGVDAYISTQRQRHGAAASKEAEVPPDEPALTPQQRMRRKVTSPEGQKIYRRRKCIPEPVFGQIKQGMGFR